MNSIKFPVQQLLSMLLISAISCISIVIHAQNYYLDIASTRQAATDMSDYKLSNVRSVKLRTFERDGSESNGFFCERKISKDFKKSSLYTRTPINGISLMESFFNDQGQLIKTYDSSDIAIKVMIYAYNDKGKLSEARMSTRSNDDDYINEQHESHLYQYDSDGCLKKMIKIKNNKDTTAVVFSCDEHQNVTIEKNEKDDIIYYYYYDDQNRLTDVVHSVPYRQNLVAEYTFDYNDAGKLISMKTTKVGKKEFIVWNYTYNGALKSKETVATMDGETIGSVTYEYK